MRACILFLAGLAVAMPATAQGVSQRAVRLAAHQLLPDSTRIRMLEARADSLADSLGVLRDSVAATASNLRTVMDGIHRTEGGKADGSSDDLWTMLKKLVDRVCEGKDRTDCP